MKTGLDTLPQTDPTSVLRYRDGIYAADLLTAALVEYDFFTWLSGNPSSFEEICSHFGWAERPADVLVALMRSNGFLFDDEAGNIRVTRLASEHLSSGSSWNLVSYYESLKDRPVVKDFVRVLATGKPAHWSGHEGAEDDWHGAMLDEDFAVPFTEAMDCRGVFLGKKLADAVRSHVDGISHFLDVGGGSGVYATALAANFTGLKVTVMEQAPVDGIARRKIEERGLSAQVKVAAGDMFKDAWPADCGGHLFSNVMHDWDIPEVLELLRKSRKAIRKDGIVLIHETFLNADKSGPRPVAEYSCILAHSTQGRCYSVAEMAEFMQQTGFQMVEHIETGGDRSVIVGKAVN